MNLFLFAAAPQDEILSIIKNLIIIVSKRVVPDMFQESRKQIIVRPQILQVQLTLNYIEL